MLSALISCIVPYAKIFFRYSRKLKRNDYHILTLNSLQCSTEEIVKEVENSIAKFKRNKQEYEEERIRDQVCSLLLIRFVVSSAD